MTAKANYEDINVGILAMIGAISVALTVAIILGLQAFYYNFQAQQQASPQFNPPPAKLISLESQQKAKLAEYRWINEKKGTVSIPIERAMKLVVADPTHGPGPMPVRKPSAKGEGDAATTPEKAADSGTDSAKQETKPDSR